MKRWTLAALVTAVASALALTACVAAPVKADTTNPNAYNTYGYTVKLHATDPLYTRPITDTSTHTLDSNQQVIYTLNGVRTFQPVYTAQYAEASILHYKQTGQYVWLLRAARNAEYLIANKRVVGTAWWYPYDYAHATGTRTIAPQWWSDMAQGEALNVFSLLAEIQPHVNRWRNAAWHTWAAFTQRQDGTNPWATTIIDGNLWFAEYAAYGQPPLQVINGDIFAIYGLYEFAKIYNSPTVRRYIDGGITGILRNIAKARVPGGIMYYCAQDPFCADPSWQNVGYHAVVTQQLATLHRITNDPRGWMYTWSQRLTADAKG